MLGRAMLSNHNSGPFRAIKSIDNTTNLPQILKGNQWSLMSIHQLRGGQLCTTSSFREDFWHTANAALLSRSRKMQQMPRQGLEKRKTHLELQMLSLAESNLWTTTFSLLIAHFPLAAASLLCGNWHPTGIQLTGELCASALHRKANGPQIPQTNHMGFFHLEKSFKYRKRKWFKTRE